MVDRAIGRLGLSPGANLIDFGCGNGSAMTRLRELGYKVVGVDIVQLHVSAIEADLSKELDERFPVADYGVCFNVLQCIEEGEDLGNVLYNISTHARKGVYFEVETRPDKVGRLIGKRLNVTIHNHNWWRDELRRFWSQVKVKAFDNDRMWAHVK